MTRSLFVLLCLLLTACANAPAVTPTPTPDPRPAAAAANESDRLNDIAATQSRVYANATFEHSQTETALPFAVAEMERQAALADIAVTQAWDDATATASVRATEAEFSAIVIPTKIAAVGTELARGAEKQKADVAAAQSRRDMWAGAPLAALVVFILLVWWVKGLIQADHKRRNNIAEAKPIVIGGQLVLPPGYTSQKIVASAPYVPALPSPVAIEERTIGGQANGQPRSIAYSQPVNEHEKRWREVLANVLFIGRAVGTFASTELCGKDKPFSSAEHWQRVTDVLRDNDLILKDNGGRTVRAGEWDEIIRRVQDANRPLRLPERLPPHLRPFELQNMH